MERRSFLNGLSARVKAAAAMAAGGAVLAKAQAPARFEAARHDKDDWLDKPGVKHRLVFDTVDPESFGDALAFANNFIRVNRTDYGVEEKDLAVVVVARHRATPFAYSDAMWAKFGPALAKRAEFTDPIGKQAPTANVYNSEERSQLLHSRGMTLAPLLKLGVQFAVCSTSTRTYATLAAGSGGNAAEIYAELTSNLLSNARMVPAGIVAVSRAQERGYSFVRG